MGKIEDKIIRNALKLPISSYLEKYCNLPKPDSFNFMGRDILAYNCLFCENKSEKLPLFFVYENNNASLYHCDECRSQGWILELLRKRHDTKEILEILKLSRLKDASYLDEIFLAIEESISPVIDDENFPSIACSPLINYNEKKDLYYFENDSYVPENSVSERLHSKIITNISEAAHDLEELIKSYKKDNNSNLITIRETDDLPF